VTAATEATPTMNRLGLRRWALIVATTISLAAAATSARAEVPIQPYGTNDAGGFRNVLPAGENGLDNATQLAEFQLKGTYPPHFADQVVELTRTLPR
jgi:hypothetical protein